MKSRRQPRPSRAELEAELNRLRLQLDDRTGKLETDALQRSQNEIEASREHYIELYDLAPFGLITLDRTGIIRALNFTATELLGQRRGKLIGCPFVSILRPGTRRLFLNQLTKLRRGQPQSTAEVEVRRPGQPPIALQLALVIPSAGRGDGAWCQAALVDITERKRAEARMAVLARLGLSLSAAVDPVGAARAIVDAALEFFGWDACFLMVHDPATDTATHLICMDTINGQRVPVSGSTLDGPVSPLARRVMEEGPHLFLRRDAEDKRLLARRFGDTSRASLSLMYVPVRQEHRSIGVLSVQSYEPVAYNQEDLAILQGLANHAGGALARLNAEASLRRANERLEARVAERTAQLQEYRDHLEELVKARTGELEAANARLREEIVSREKAEQALLRSAEDLKRSNLDLEQFAYAITHDLQEPLRAVSGFVRLLEHRCPAKLDTKMREYIHGAAEGAQRMDQLITDLLAYSRVGTQGRQTAATDLGEPLKAALRNLQFAIRAAKASVTNDPLPTVVVDGVQMSQLFQNLLANAIKFRNEAAPEIHVGARAEPGHWVIFVRDNGIGIDPQYFQRIFQVFQRLHTRTKYPGTGIGLSICKKIVEQHGGKIWVESQPEQGSTFYFSIPGG